MTDGVADISWNDAARFRPVERRTAAQVIADGLRQAIACGDLQPGEQLPAQRRLAMMFGVSVPTLREALGVLRSQARIRCVQGEGTYVTRERPRPSTAAALRTASAEELQATREVVEERSARLAAERAAADAMTAMETRPFREWAMDIHLGHGGRANRLVELDAAFHDRLLTLGGRSNVYGTEVGRTVLHRLERQRMRGAHRLAADDRLWELHFDLAAAIDDGRGWAAAQLAKRIVRREAAAVR